MWNRFLPFAAIRPAAAWAMGDQAAVALANFALSLSMARYATPSEYGLFVIVLTLSWFYYGCLQVPLVLQPLIFVGGKKEGASDARDFIRRTLAAGILLSIVSVATLLLSSAALSAAGSPSYAKAALLACAPLPFVGLRFFVRCFYIMRGRFFQACASDTIVLICIACGIPGLKYLDRIDSVNMVGLWAASEAAPVVFLALYRPARVLRTLAGWMSDFLNQARVWMWTEVRENYRYGKWLLLTTGVNYAQQKVQFLLLPLFVGIGSVGAYHACFLITQPIYQFATGIEAYVWHRSIRNIKTGGAAELQSFLSRMTVSVSILSALYVLVVGLNTDFLFNILYGGRFREFASLVWLFGGVAMLSVWAKMQASGLLALEATECLFSSGLWGSVVGLAGLLIFARTLGLTGAAIAYLLGSLVTAVLLEVYFRRRAQVYRDRVVEVGV